jgi:peptidoglycan/LPS O-acetylase OafA/YrhL
MNLTTLILPKQLYWALASFYMSFMGGNSFFTSWEQRRSFVLPHHVTPSPQEEETPLAEFTVKVLFVLGSCILLTAMFLIEYMYEYQDSPLLPIHESLLVEV